MVRPIEIADVLSRAEIVRKFNEIKKQAPEMDQRQYRSKLQKETSEKAGRTQESGKSDLVTITKEQRERREDKKRQREKEEETPNKKSAEEPDKGENLDLKA